MNLLEEIQRHLGRLPASLQARVLDFVESLAKQADSREDADWSSLSLAGAMRGMKNEDPVQYTMADLKTKF